MWLDSFHYESAIDREDIMFTGSIVKNTVLDMVQVIYALNEAYFAGDKKLEKQLAKLDYCPGLLLSNVELLFSAPKDKEKRSFKEKYFVRYIKSCRLKQNSKNNKKEKDFILLFFM